jgi:hypothetical protein
MSVSSRVPGAARRRWRRAADVGSNLLLGVLVLSSLGLSGVLWSGALWAASPAATQLSGASSYQLPGDLESGGTTTGVASPERLVLLYPSAAGDVALGDPASAAFIEAWNAVLALLPRVATAAARPIGFKDVAAELAAYASPSPFRGGAECRAGVEVDVGAALPWADWLGAATGATPAGQWTGPVDRAVLLPGPANGGAELLLLDGASAREVAVAATPYSVLEGALCAILPQAQSAGYPVAPLAPDGAQGGLPHGVLASVPDPGAILVPEASSLPSWEPLRLVEEPVSPSRLAQAVFPNLLAVRRTATHGSVVFTSAGNWMLTVAPGESTLIVPAAAGAAPPWGASLVAALRFVDSRGGWPRGTWLSGAQVGSSCTILSCAAPTALTYSFSTRAAGLPVLTTLDSPPAISVTVGAGGDPTFYLRAVRVPGAPAEPQGRIVSAATAIDAVYRDPPPALTGSPLEVVGILPAWMPGAALLEPVWAVEVDAAPWGRPYTELVSATSGQVTGLWGAL